MKTIKNKIKLWSFALSLLVVFQSCTAYKATSVNLEQAAKDQVKTKIETNYGTHIKFNYIGYENGNYYGAKKIKGKVEKMQLNEEHIKSVKLKDKTTSTILTIALPIGLLAGLGLVFQNSFKWKDPEPSTN